jgi:hypothetical protein
MLKKQMITMSGRDVGGGERFFVVSEDEEGVKEIVGVVGTLDDAKTVAAKVKTDAVSILKQVGFGFYVSF